METRRYAGPDLVRITLIMLMASLVVSGLVAVWVFVFSPFDGRIEAQIMLTTLVLGLFSLTGLSAAGRIQRRIVVPLGWLGLASSALALVLAEVVIWTDFWEWDKLLRVFAVSTVVAGACAYASLLLLLRPRSQAVGLVVGGTLALLGTVASMIIALVLSSSGYGETYWRALGGLSILTVMGTLVAPLLNRILR